MKHIGALILLAFAASGCGSGSSDGQPSAPSQPTATRIISIVGTGNFGSTTVGSKSTAGFSIENTGNSTLTVSGISLPSGFTVDKTSGAIAPSGLLLVTVTFTPPSVGSFGGSMTVASDATSGTGSLTLSATGAAPIQTGPTIPVGQTRVGGNGIQAGRYFAAPASGCYWERDTDFSGNLSAIIANDFISFSAPQWILDVSASDFGVTNQSPCGVWNQTPRVGAQSKIVAGMYLVGSQLTPGTYFTNATNGCYWERLRSFGGQLGEILANDFVSGSKSEAVTILSGDVGFDSNPQCGTWSASQATSPQSIAGVTSQSSIAANRALAHRGGK